MELIKDTKEDVCTIKIVGRLDTTTSPELEKELVTVFSPGVSRLILDCEKMDYISSSGLRVFLQTQKHLAARNQKMKLINVNDVVFEVLEMTGFIQIIEVEKAKDESQG